MLIRPHHQRVRLQQIADGLLGALAVSLAYGLRSWFPWLDLPELENFYDYVWLMLLCALLTPVLLTQQGFYVPDPLDSRVAAIFKIMRACAYTVLGLILFLFIVRVQYARSVIILSGAFASFLIYGRHELAQALRPRGAADLARKRVSWLGRPEAIAAWRNALSPAEAAVLEFAGEADPAAAPFDLPAALHRHAITLVILVPAGLEPATVAALVEACDREGVELLIHPGVRVTSSVRLAMDQLGGVPVLYYRAQSARAFDLALSSKR